MIEGLDSAAMPNVAQVQAAQAAGRRIWNGYLATKAGVGLYSPWSKGGFDNARLLGSTPIAYCSGWDDPVALKALAASWSVRLCLDVEGGIRGDGPWVQGFLDSSGAGLYGNPPVHPGRRAPFYVCAVFPVLGDPGGESWPSWLPRPSAPCGWQWCGTHSEFGIGVDSTWFDDWFAGFHGEGAGSVTRTSRRVTTMAAAKSLHQWLRGDDTPAGGPHALFHRRRSGGVWTPWVKLGGQLGSDVITPGLDETGAIVVTVLGTDSKFYDYTSSDDGLTWSHPVNNGGGGDGMVAMSAGQSGAVGAVDLSPTGSLAWVKTSLDTVAGDAQTIRQRIEKDLAP